MMLAMLVACEPSHLEDNLLDSTVYFSRSGINSASFYDAEGTFDYPFYAVNAGYFRGETSVTITKDVTALNKYNEDNEASLKELPADCYTLIETKGQITKDEDACKFIIRFDCEKLQTLSQEGDYSDLKDYVVPLSLTTDGGIAANENLNTLLIHPDMKKIAVSLEMPGEKLSEMTVLKKDIKGTMEYEFSFNLPADNNWETIFDVLSGDAAIQYINGNIIKRASLSTYSALTPVPSDAYTIDFNNTMDKGTPVATMKFTIDAAKMPEGCSSIACYLNGVTVDGEAIPIEGNPYLIIHFQNAQPISTVGLVSVTDGGSDDNYLGKYLEGSGYAVLPRTGWVFSPESYHNNSYGNAIDGKTNSIWENRYNDNANSSGPKSSLPFNAILDLGMNQTFTALEIWRRISDKYVHDLREFELYVSDDKVNWKYVTTIDYGTSADQRAMYNVIPKVSGHYINFYITKTNRPTNINMAEIFLWNK